MDPSRPDGAGNGKVRAAMRSLCLLVAGHLALAVPLARAEPETPPQRQPCFSYGEVVSTSPDGMACILAAGRNWENLKQASLDPSA